MGDRLRERRLPREFAENRQVIEISEKIGNFETLAKVLEEDLSALEVDKVPANWRDSILAGRLEFGFAAVAGEVPTVTGALDVVIAAVCQRCLAPFELPLSTTFNFALSGPECAVEANDDYEIWELAGDTVSPIEIVEEALLLAMPLSTMHPARCVDIEADVGREKMTTPFASLRRQMVKGKSV